VLLFPGLRLVVEDVGEAGAELQEVDMAGGGMSAKREGKAAGTEVGKFVGGQIARDFSHDRGLGGRKAFVTEEIIVRQ